MGNYSHNYTQGEIDDAEVDSIYDDYDDVSTDMFYIYTEDYEGQEEGIIVFAHMLDGLRFLIKKLDLLLIEKPDQKSQIEELSSRLKSEINYINENASDRSPALLMKILGEKNILGINCGGYWEELVETSSDYWEKWGTRYIESRSTDIYYESRNRINDNISEEDFMDLDDIDCSDMDYIEGELMGLYIENYENKDDSIEDPDFIRHLKKILPYIEDGLKGKSTEDDEKEDEGIDDSGYYHHLELITPFQSIYDSIIEGNREAVKKHVQAALDEGLEPTRIYNEAMITAMNEVGHLFNIDKYFFPEVMISAFAMQDGLAILKPHLAASGFKAYGKVVIGAFDIHETGKTMVCWMLKSAGFEVVDLGKYMSSDEFVEAVKNGEANIVAMSAGLTTTMEKMKLTIEALKEAGVRDQVKVMVGGAPLTEAYAREIGADGYAPNALQAVVLARTLVGR